MVKDGRYLSGISNNTGLPHAVEGSTSKCCIAWSIGPNHNSGKTVKQAVWTIDGAVVNTQDLFGWTRPLTPMISYWSSAISWDGLFTFEKLGVSEVECSCFMRIARFCPPVGSKCCPGSTQ